MKDKEDRLLPFILITDLDDKFYDIDWNAHIENSRKYYRKVNEKYYGNIRYNEAIKYINKHSK